MNKFKVFFIFVIGAFSSGSFADVILKDGILCNVDFYGRPIAEKNIIKPIGEIFKANGVKTPLSCLGWVGSDLNNWFEVSENKEIYGVNISNKQYLGNWRLNNYPDYFLESTLPISKPANDFVLDAPNQGCLVKMPIRYGDIDQDGQLEVVIFLGGIDQTDLFVFSPSVKKTMFGMNIAILHSQGIDGFNDDSPEAYQYNSDIQNTPVPTSEPGFQAYGKIFIDDFDDDKARDIILWHKYYESRENKDPIKGFRKVSDTFIHYKLINGEYQKQSTPEETIKGWLAAKQLTWQKGYPSKSECPGQEGQLIPEMHDPLLNDPDALQ